MPTGLGKFEPVPLLVLPSTTVLSLLDMLSIDWVLNSEVHLSLHMYLTTAVSLHPVHLTSLSATLNTMVLQ